MTDDGAAEILLVEDNPHDVDLTLRAMKRHNLLHRVRVARDGQEALDFVFREGAYADRVPAKPPRLVLLDLKLPKVDGVEVLRRIKEDKDAVKIPVVMLTSSVDERDMVRCYRLGVNSYIQKPVDFDKFLDCVAELGHYWLLLNRVAEA